jgi:hypothetical protein
LPPKIWARARKSASTPMSKLPPPAPSRSQS